MFEALTLVRPLVVFDLETTGTSTDTDRIVELSAIRFAGGGGTCQKTWRLKPGIPISAEAQAVHGISNEDVADCPSFGQKAVEILAFFQGCDVAGFNCRRFDVPLLVVEFGRVGVEWEPGCVVDVFEIYRKFRPNTLAQAVRDYLGHELEGAHGAAADTEATAEVLWEQIALHGLPLTVPELADCTRDPSWIDREGKIKLNGEGEAVIGFGKHESRTLREMCLRERSYLRWMLKSNFPVDTCRILEEALAGRFPGGPAEPEQGVLL